MKHISRTVFLLSAVSLFTDMASEMLYPIMPVYLKHIGFSILFIGMLEGIVEAVAGLGKSYFGKLSDNSGKRLPFVQLGYSLSALSKPMFAFFITPAWVFFVRTIDRVGKGIRTGARDALLSAEATTETKASVFGFHRSMDTLGAVLGPAFALGYLYFNPENYKTLFLIAFVPGLFAIVASLLIKEKNLPPKKYQKASLFSFVHYWKTSTVEYKKLVFGLLLFTLINSSDVFLLLKVKSTSLSDTYVIGLYIFYNLVYAIAAFPLGILADKIGFKIILLLGFSIFSVVYFFIGNTTNFYFLVLAFFLYGIYAAATEGVAKAWVTNISTKESVATAVGTFSGLQSICALLASSLAGFLWYKFGASFLFYFSAAGSFLVIVYFIYFIKKADKI